MTSHLELQQETHAPNRSHSRAYWVCQFGGWGLILLLDASVALVGAGPRFLDTLGIVATTGVAGLLISHGWHHVLKHRGWLEPPFRRAGLRILVGVVLCAASQLFIVWLAFLIFLPATQHGSLLWLPSAVLVWLLVFSVWTTCYAVILKLRRAHRIEIEKLQLELVVKDANLRALEAQINPHFFFNSLNSVRALMYQDTDAAAEMIDRLASRLRFTLQGNSARTVTLGTEMDAVRNYLEIERIRFDERLKVEESIEHGATEISLPPMVLQTLVENAVKYGVEKSVGSCTIKINARLDGKSLHVCVANQGQLVESTGSTRVGLSNAARRLALLFGSKASLDISEQDGWVLARLAVPTQRGLE